MKDYLLYLSQSHLQFRKAELESLAELNNLQIDFSNHDTESPFLIIHLENDEQASKLVSRGILIKAIYELWGQGTTFAKLHESVKSSSKQYWDNFNQDTFKFELISYNGGNKTPLKKQLEMFDSFKYLPFRGKINLKNPEQRYVIFQNFEIDQETQQPTKEPNYCYFARQVEISLRSRGVLEKLEIAKRPFYGTTTFETELSLVTCNLGLVKSGQLVWDPFVGTGSFLLAATQFATEAEGDDVICFGNDIDFLTLKGKKGKRIKHNFDHVLKKQCFGDVMCMDFTNSALRNDLKIDCILSDPPYGIREGLKVCGVQDLEKIKGKETLKIDGELAFLRKDYIQPKKPYSLDLILDDLLQFAVDRLPIDGRLCFWMPVANDEDIPTMIPQNEKLELIYNLQQDFNRWSRRLLVYVRRGDDYIGVKLSHEDRGVNNFRDRYFNGFSKSSKSGAMPKK